MTLDGFLTVLGLLAAVYAVVPPVMRLQARLGLALQLPLAIVAFSLILYLEFFRLVGRPCDLDSAFACRLITFVHGGLAPNQAAFLVCLVWMAAAVIVHRLARPGPGALRPIQRLTEQLLYERRYTDLVSFVEPYLPVIGRAARRTLWQQKLADRAWRWRHGHTDAGRWRALVNQEPNLPWSGRHFWRRGLPLLGWLLCWTPRFDKAQAMASDLARSLYGSAELLTFVVEMRPYFGLAMLQARADRGGDFDDRFLGRLIAQPASALYAEIADNQNMASVRRYFLHPRNRLLTYLFADVSHAQVHGAWSPTGNFALEILREDVRPDYVARLNRRQRNYQEEALEDPIWVALSFFDMMVTEAAFQDLRDTMWVAYWHDVVRGITAAFDGSVAGFDEGEELPTFGSYLLYEIFDAYRRWITLAEDLPSDAYHRRLEASAIRQGTNVIPLAAARSFGIAIGHVVMAESVPWEVQRTLLALAASCVAKLPAAEGDGLSLRALLIESILAGNNGRLAYRRRLAEILGSLDHGVGADAHDLMVAAGALNWEATLDAWRS